MAYVRQQLYEANSGSNIEIQANQMELYQRVAPKQSEQHLNRRLFY